MVSIVADSVIAYCGLTHLSLCSGVAAAEKGFRTILFDPDAGRVAPVKQGILPVKEPDLDELFVRNRTRLQVTHDAAALAAADLVYISPDVPTDDTGRSDLAPIDALLRIVKPALRPDVTLVILSQVAPGFTRALPDRFGGFPGPLHYQVETLIFGRAMERALLPERFIVGSFDPSAPLPVALQQFLSAFNCPVLPMRLESAELAKISINMCLVAMIGVANTMAEICESIGADWSEIITSLKLDRRIGHYAYLTPGLGLAGGNLERDLATVIRLGEAHYTDTGIVSAWVSNSQHRKAWAGRVLRARLLDHKPDSVVSVLGLAYKENTHSTKNSPSLALIGSLGEERRVRVHDPVVPASAAGVAATGFATPLACAEGADAVLLMTPWPEYKTIDVAALARAMRGRLLIDPYRVLDAAAAERAGLDYVTLGVPGPAIKG